MHSAQQGSADVRGTGFGTGLKEAVDEVSKFLGVQAARRDRIESDEGITALSSKALELEQGARKARMKDAYGVTQRSLKALDEYWADLSGSMRPRVLEGVTRTMNSLRLSMGRSLSAHETAQTDAYEDSTFAAFTESQKSAYSQVRITEGGPDPMDEGFIVGRTEERIRAYVAHRGGDRQMAESAVRKWKAQAAMTRLEELVASREYEAARQFAASRMDWIRAGGEDTEKAEKLVALAGQESEARATADAPGALEDRLKAAERIQDSDTRARAIQLIRQEESNRSLILESRDMRLGEGLRQKMALAVDGEVPELTAQEFAYLGPARAREWRERAEWTAAGGQGFYSRKERRSYEQVMTMMSDPTGRMKLADMGYKDFEEKYLDGLPEESNRGNLRDRVFQEWRALKEAVGRERSKDAEDYKPTRPMARNASESFRKAIGAPVTGDLDEDQATEVTRMFEELEDAESEHHRRTGKNPTAGERMQMISDIVVGRVVDSDWVNEYARVEDLQDVGDAILEKNQLTGSESSILMPRIRRYARANGVDLDDDDLRRVLALRRVMASPRATDNQYANAAYLLSEILGSDVTNEADRMALDRLLRLR